MNWRYRLLGLIILTHLLPVAALWIVLEQSQDPLGLFLLIPLLLVLVLGWSLYSSIASPLKELSSNIEEVAAGDLTIRTSKLPGIFGAIGSALNTITGKLQEFVTRTQAETEVIVSEANRLRMILNSISDGVLALDKNKNIILFNKAASAITGLGIPEVAGKHINSTLPLTRNNKLVVSEWFDECKGMDITQNSWENVAFTTKAGEKLSLSIDAQYVGADPNGVRTLITFHNRTEEQQIEDMKIDFVALAAHELRTPVSIIKGYLEILGQEVGPQLTPEHQEFIRKLEVSAGQLSGSINNILHVSNIEHGDLSLHLDTSEWNEIVQTCCAELNKKAETMGEKLKLILLDEEVYVAVDKIGITEVIINLVDNAIKYSKRGQNITVKVSRDRGAIITEVMDEGTGIPSSNIDKLFTKFYRSHRTRASHRGTGLGLYMSKSIVEAHGGRIWVESKEGKGSTFGFELPEVAKDSSGDDNSNITRGVHGWIKNHSLYRG